MKCGHEYCVYIYMLLYSCFKYTYIYISGEAKKNAPWMLAPGPRPKSADTFRSSWAFGGQEPKEIPMLK
jgi:hypothetical protein